jgi:4-hydroxy-tetrahydrodipicolinate reductase
MMEGVESLTLAGALEQPGHPAGGKSVGEVVGLPQKDIPISDSLAELLPQADVLIEFTHPEPTLEHLQEVAAAGKAMVIGTTGLSPQQVDKLKGLAARTRVVFAPNMSVGVNLMFKVVEHIARVLSEGYDVEIVEAHHRLKKDAPSGTALKLAQIIAQALGRDLDEVGVYGRKGITGERSKEEIGIMTVRAGDIVGEHTVTFCGIGERLEVIHRAHNRDNFARGAVRAAQWIVDQQPGLYDMQDVLGLR